MLRTIRPTLFYRERSFLIASRRPHGDGKKKKKPSGREGETDTEKGRSSRRGSITDTEKGRSSHRGNITDTEIGNLSKKKREVPTKLYGGGVRLNLIEEPNQEKRATMLGAPPPSRQEPPTQRAPLASIGENDDEDEDKGEGGVSLTTDPPTMTAITRDMQALSMPAPYPLTSQPPQGFFRSETGEIDVGVRNSPSSTSLTSFYGPPLSRDHYFSTSSFSSRSDTLNPRLASDTSSFYSCDSSTTLVSPHSLSKGFSLQAPPSSETRTSLNRQLLETTNKLNNLHEKSINLEKQGKKLSYQDLETYNSLYKLYFDLESRLNALPEDGQPPEQALSHSSTSTLKRDFEDFSLESPEDTLIDAQDTEKMTANERYRARKKMTTELANLGIKDIDPTLFGAPAKKIGNLKDDPKLEEKRRRHNEASIRYNQRKKAHDAMEKAKLLVNLDDNVSPEDFCAPPKKIGVPKDDPKLERKRLQDIEAAKRSDARKRIQKEIDKAKSLGTLGDDVTPEQLGAPSKKIGIPREDPNLEAKRLKQNQAVQKSKEKRKK